MRPDLSEAAFLRRHQNPLGFAVRGIAFVLLSIALWAHWPLAALVAMLIEAANWLYCPEYDNPPEWVEQVLDTELAIFEVHPVGLRIALAGAFAFGFALYGLGLWAHHFGTLVFGVVLLAAISGLLRWLGRV